ncbi:MAG: bifunctional nuclease family protein [Muribaculaceae bacterium]|nr:bifunctional nuclease family protein [Muribaculaceae bacterium]
MERIQLEVLGITYGPIRQSAYALLLKQVDGERRIPIVIGTPEAQAIAMRLENIIAPRPMSHDLMASIMHAFAISLEEVYIYDFQDGVFQCRMTLVDSHSREVELECRASDAIALALRTGADIFTTPQVMDATGYDLNELERRTLAPSKREPKRLEEMSDEQLERRKQRAVEREDYELAAQIQQILATRRTSNK